MNRFVAGLLGFAVGGITAVLLCVFSMGAAFFREQFSFESPGTQTKSQQEAVTRRLQELQEWRDKTANEAKAYANEEFSSTLAQDGVAHTRKERLIILQNRAQNAELLLKRATEYAKNREYESGILPK